MKDRVILLSKWAPDELPPVLNVCRFLKACGYEVALITTSCGPAHAQWLNSHGICALTTHTQRLQSRTHVGKLVDWKHFRSRAWSLISSFDRDDMLWVSGADTAIALGSGLRRRRYVVQLHELYEPRSIYRALIDSCLRTAGCVVVPSSERAGIIRHWHNLPATPLVLPNIAPLDGAPAPADVSEAVEAELAEMAQYDGCTVLYQGNIGPVRQLGPVAAAVSRLGSTYRLVLMGRDYSHLSHLRRLCPSLRWIPPIPPPFHLGITARAHVGVVSYDYSTLNHVFCAPNKIWEYAANRVPMLCNDVPALRRAVEEHGAGICTDFSDVGAIARGIVKLRQDGGRFATNAYALFKSINPLDIVRGAMARCAGRDSSSAEYWRGSYALVESDDPR